MGAEGRSLGGVEGRGATWLNIVQVDSGADLPRGS
jgi:hypothetical protein